MTVDWLPRAACRDYDPTWWEAGDATLNLRAKRICGTCPVQAECSDRANRLGSIGMIIAGKLIRRDGEYASGGSGRISRQCVKCRRPFWTANARQIFCRNACRVAVHSRRRAAQKRMGAP